jgi:hypothetical protein
MVDGAEINYGALPQFCRDSAADYFERRMMPGSGWLAILECSLYAVTRVDDETRAALPQIVRWLHNYAPSNAWGSRDKVNDWLHAERNAGVHPVLRPIVNSIAPFTSPEFVALNAATKEGL